MTKFDINQFDMGRGGERWVFYGPERKFVGRFKYRGGSAAKDFVKFLIKNFEVEEYFELLKTPNPDNAFNNTYSPGEILRMKGYINPNMRKAMKAAGCTTQEEYLAKRRQEIQDRNS